MLYSSCIPVTEEFMIELMSRCVKYAFFGALVVPDVVNTFMNFSSGTQKNERGFA